MHWARVAVAGLLCAAMVGAQEKKDTTIFRTETRLVPVDVIVTDKKGNYIHDLEAKDFRIWEDNKEQQIKNFGFEADPASPLATQQKYFVLFFDNSSMALSEQAQARQAAIKFIDANAGANRLMAIANFGGSLRISQNFTDDVERLKQVVSGIKTAYLSTAEPATVGRGGVPQLGAEAQLGARSVLLALRNLAKGLEDVPGRKTLVLLSSGFPLTPELISEITAAIDACNKANIAIYPIDVRGLTTVPFAPTRGAVSGPQKDLAYAGVAMAGLPVMRLAAFMAEQGRGGTTAGGGATAPAGGTSSAPAGGTTSGGSEGGGARGGGGGIGGASSGNSGGNSGNIGGNGGVSRGNPAGSSPGGFGGGEANPNGNFGGRGGGLNPDRNNPLGRPREVLLPTIPESALTNQQVLYRLAEGTGGFVIANTNDMVGGLQKIGKEQNEYYMLAYTAPESAEGSCHEIRVKVTRGGTNVRSRPGYCNVKAKDALAGKPVERKLETQITSPGQGTIPTTPMQAAFTYVASNTARVNVALEVPTKDVKFEKIKGKQHAEINVMGIAYRPNGDVGARFSDAVKFDFDDKKEIEKFASKPYEYQNQFEIGAGQYSLKVVFSSGGEGFGKQEQALNIGAYESGEFAMSEIVLSHEAKKMTTDLSLDAELMEGRTPLVAGTMQFQLAGTRRFKTTEQPVMYFEVYEPLVADAAAEASKAQLGVQLKVFERASGEQKLDSGGVDMTRYIRPGNPVVPLGLKLPVNGLTPGGYRLQLLVVDSAGKNATRTVEFDVL